MRFVAIVGATGTALAWTLACSMIDGKQDVPPHDHSSHSHGGAAGAPNASPPIPVAESTTFDWELPSGFPVPWEPEDNPTTKEKVELGRHLFYDKRLSRNGAASCASCHVQELAFTDGRAKSVGTTGETHPRSAMSLANVGYASTLTWAHPLLYELERQALVPLFGTEPVELGLVDETDAEARVAEDLTYETLFAEAFPESTTRGTLAQIVRALAAFQRTLISGDAPYDRWIRGESEAMSVSAQRGYALFHSEKLECFHCHAGFNFSNHVHFAEKAFFETPFHNTGLYNLDGKGAYPAESTGIASITMRAGDMGRFKAPTLRNIAVTAPYMHDGSIATLSEVLDHYAAAGRTIEGGPFAGRGSESPLKDPLVIGFTLTDEERADVLAFLEALTDKEFLTNPAFSNPWGE